MGYMRSLIPLWLRALLDLAGLLCLSPFSAAVAAGLVVVAGAWLYSKHLSERAASV